MNPCDDYSAIATAAGLAWLPVCSGTDTSCELRLGHKNAGVLALQVSLNQCYSQGIPEDGDFGPVTEAALKRVQAKVGTTVDGLYGPYTRDAMLHAGTWGDERLRYDGPGGK
ncbi:peptidoglycan-binding domain-containing protein [Streptomyces europaeiscabiei]|uniref:peptidoglycan-binding domain-containing protein n=1 Tax=Streptomyces europaeiscabiei TaxID=146819 RepID=UPI0038F60F85